MDVGDRVFLKSTSKWFAGGGNNPSSEDTIGTITRIRDMTFPIRVEWDGMGENVYREEDLKLVSGESYEDAEI